MGSIPDALQGSPSVLCPVAVPRLSEAFPRTCALWLFQGSPRLSLGPVSLWLFQGSPRLSLGSVSLCLFQGSPMLSLGPVSLWLFQGSPMLSLGTHKIYKKACRCYPTGNFSNLIKKQNRKKSFRNNRHHHIKLYRGYKHIFHIQYLNFRKLLSNPLNIEDMPLVLRI